MKTKLSDRERDREKVEKDNNLLCKKIKKKISFLLLVLLLVLLLLKILFLNEMLYK